MREAGLTTCRHSQREKATALKGNGEARYTRGTGHRQVAPLSIVSTARMNVGLRAIMAMIEPAVEQVPTYHDVLLGDARRAVLPAESVHLTLTSPPYWTLQEYRRTPGQLGWIADYDDFLDQLDSAWRVWAYQMNLPRST